MRKWLAVLLSLLLAVALFGCSETKQTVEYEEFSRQEDLAQVIGTWESIGMGSGMMADSVHQALTGEGTHDRWLEEEVVVAVVTITDQIDTVRMAGDSRQVVVHEVLKGEIESGDHIHQMFIPESYLVAGGPYLLILMPYYDNAGEFNIIGVENQCAFWVENGKLCGMDADLVAEIQSSTAAYGAKGAAPDVNTMNGLVDYFAARVAALE